LSSNSLLFEELSRLGDTLKEEIKIDHVLLDLENRQVNKHTSDFGSVIVNLLLNEFENCATNSLLVLRVHLVHSAQNWKSHGVELLRTGMVGRENVADLWGEDRVNDALCWELDRNWGHLSLSTSNNGLLDLLVREVSLALAVMIAATLLAIATPLTLLVALTVAVLLGNTSVLVSLLATLVVATLGRSPGLLISHTSHQLFDNSGDLILVKSTLATIFLDVTSEILLVFGVLVF
jgi:hypothetical protein